MTFLGLVEEIKGSIGHWKLIDDYMKINQKIIGIEWIKQIELIK